jgi:cardiolipin synthase
MKSPIPRIAPKVASRIPSRIASHKARVVVIAIACILASLVAMLLVINFSSGEKQITQNVTRLYSLEDPQFQRTIGAMLGSQIVDGNRFETLLNGDQIFPSMLEAIRGAQKSISFETYIYWSGDIGRTFADALSERARAGVPVHVLIDWVGSSKMEPALLDEMRKSGVEVRKFHPLRWYTLGRLNDRTHRKLLVVDGRIGFTGGVGIAPEWTGHAQDPQHWRDSHFRVEGPVVAQMQAVLLDNWTKTTGQVLHGTAYFPPLQALQVPGGRAQVFSSSPESGSESMHLMYLLAITAAQHSIDIANSYFVPDEMTRHALTEALKRGVRVRILTPGDHIDAETVRASSRGLWGDLLRLGARIYEYQPTMFHCKVMIVDGLMVSVGSTNFDDRSFRMNDESNLNIYDATFANEQTAVFEEDLRHARQVTYAAWQARPWTEKLHEKVASVLAPML